MGRISGVQRPGVLRPGPPHQPEHDHRMPCPDPGQILVYQADSLGHSVDEHQIEEELDERRALVLSGGDRPLRHPGIIKRAALRLAPNAPTTATFAITSACVHPMVRSRHYG